MVYLQHRVSPHSYSRDRRWDRPCRQSAHLGHFCLQLHFRRRALSSWTSPRLIMRRTILVLVLLQVVAVDLGAPAVLRVSSHHVVLSASRQPPQGAPSTRSRRGPRAVARMVVAGAPEPPSGLLDCSSCCSACTVLCTVVGPTVPEATTWPWARPSLQHGPARRHPTHAAPIARSAGPMTTLRDPSPGVLLAAAPLHHRLQRRQAHCRRQVTGTGAVPQQTEI